MNGTTEKTKHAIWNALLSAGRLHRYWTKVRDRHMQYGKLLKFAEVVSAFLLLFVNINHASPVVIALSMILTTILALHIFLPDKSEIIDTMVKDLGDVESRYTVLFDDANEDDISEEEARYKHAFLNAYINNVTNRAKVTVDAKLNEECQEEACEAIKNRYAT